MTYTMSGGTINSTHLLTPQRARNSRVRIYNKCCKNKKSTQQLCSWRS